MESPDSSEMMWKTDTEELSDSKHVNNFTNTVTVKDEQSDSSSDTSLSSPSDSTVTSICGAKKEKLCLVCGDKALGYNFNAVSCESCKAFFRRNAHKTIRGRCEGKCDVNVESRSFCKRCRLAKCFTIGMRKDMILNDEQKQMRKQKIIINKLRRQGHMPPQDTYSASVGDIISSSVSTSPASSVTDDSSQTSVRAKRKPSPIQNQSDMSSGNSTDFIPWIHSQDIVRAVLQKLEVKHRQLIEETEFAMTDSSFLTMTSTSLRTLPANPTEFINVAEVFVRKVIKVAKNVAVFKTMHKDDQIALLKGSVVDIMMIRSAVNYDPYTETWSLSTVDCLKRRCSADSDCVDSSNTNITTTTTTIPTITSSNTISSQSSMISAELLKSGNPETRILFMTYSKFIKALMKGIHGDLIILKLLIMMSLFSADRITLLEPEKVQHAQEQYATALQAYAALRFPEDRTLFARLVMKLTDLRNINEVHSKMLLKMKMDDIEPLLLEIFDLPA